MSLEDDRTDPDRAGTAALKIIDDLGGAGCVARICGIGQPAVSMWRRRGRIPAAWQPLLAEAAIARGIEVPSGFLRRQP